VDEREAGRYCSVPLFLTVPAMIQDVPAPVAYVLLAIGVVFSIICVILRQWIVIAAVLIGIVATWSWIASRTRRNPRWFQEAILSRFSRRHYAEHRNLQS
jgi:hypothetical protein